MGGSDGSVAFSVDCPAMTPCVDTDAPIPAGTSVTITVTSPGGGVLAGAPM